MRLFYLKCSVTEIFKNKTEKMDFYYIWPCSMGIYIFELFFFSFYTVKLTWMTIKFCIWGPLNFLISLYNPLLVLCGNLTFWAPCTWVPYKPSTASCKSLLILKDNSKLRIVLMVEIKWRPIYLFYCVYNVLSTILKYFGTLILIILKLYKCIILTLE